MYVGSTEPVTSRSWAWVMPPPEGEGVGAAPSFEESAPGRRRQQQQQLGQMVSRELTTTPALVKIFDEILVNAADNSARGAGTKLIAVTIDPLEPRITVWNDGNGECTNGGGPGRFNWW